MRRHPKEFRAQATHHTVPGIADWRAGRNDRRNLVNGERCGEETSVGLGGGRMSNHVDKRDRCRHVLLPTRFFAVDAIGGVEGA